jgi:hypothetical protein
VVAIFFQKLALFTQKIGTVPTKNGTVHPKFGEKIRIDQVRFFSTRQIFKHWSSVDQQGNIQGKVGPRSGTLANDEAKPGAEKNPEEATTE